MNQVEGLAYRDKQSYVPYDAIAAASFLFPEKVDQVMNRYDATIKLAGRSTRGEVIVNSKSPQYNVNIIENISDEEFKQILLWTADY